ncbi:T6SS immunity protein Tli4 family protein [Azospira inquinata]|uniref:Tle cognate immunity protein 4 C-terminal domain-containing protein n=1 Tax=Azospira inquinata TaxID=2785627 RepID=A0A975XVX8_9RHOO|nr:T6SS immunity protein Tli4 family protein [Azospira inquinata]QWT47058.1 hypothetical protein J8L76_04935 [Azospira inquinata]QWT50313.1 hypothetical protein Azoinq_06935 [Azospira inquinata]
MQKFLMLVTALFLTVSGANGQGNNSVMQTINLGRFLVSIPKDVNIVGQGYFYVDDLIIKKTSFDSLQNSIKEDEDKINSKNSKYQVVKIVNGAKKGSSVIIKRRKNYIVYGHELGYELSGYFWLNGYLYQLKSECSVDRLTPTLEKMLSLISSAQPLNDREIPTIPGFCVKGAFFPGVPPYDHYESAEIFLRLKKYPDVTVKISVRTNAGKMDDGLISRVDKKPLPAEFNEIAKGIKKLRKGKHNVGNMEGEEILETYPTDDGYSVHTFTWESDGKPNDIYHPVMVVNVNSGRSEMGGFEKPLISDKEAISLFDEIVNSIRVRPIK